MAPTRSVLVFAPHPDDELLATGGAIQQHLRRGEAVKVILLTNGDGQRSRPLLPHEHFRRLGRTRQQETIAAVAGLGLGSDQIIFLGYPDRGLGRLWKDCWTPDRLYRSKYTGVDHSPYGNAFRPQAPYCGQSLVRDLQEILRSERPCRIYLPHPHDQHSDHRATHAFVTYAVEQWQASAPAAQSADYDLWTYVIHRGRWPTPRGLHPDLPLTPPRPLLPLDTRWICYELRRHELLRKIEALRAYRTQMRFMKQGMMSYARRTEVFGLVPVLSLNGRPTPLDAWVAAESPQPSIEYVNSSRSRLLTRWPRANEIKSVRLSHSPSGIDIGLTFCRRLPAACEIDVCVKPIGVGEGMSTILRWQVAPHSARRALHVKLGRAAVDWARRIMIGVEVLHRGRVIAQTATRLVELR